MTSSLSKDPTKELAGAGKSRERAMEEAERNPNPGKPKVVVIMGATGSGKSRLAIDLASFFPAEILNADSMQVYEGLDVLTNKVPLQDRKGVPHHLLGTIPSNVDFTAKNFRDMAIPIIDNILSRNHLPIIVGGTNYYIQALLCPFLLDESTEEMEDEHDVSSGSSQQDFSFDEGGNQLHFSHDILRELDPMAANRIHPNDHRKINNYLRLHASSGIIPSKLLQGKASENWGHSCNLRYDCCFVWVDASLSVLDQYVKQRVDDMVKAGLLEEVYDIYNPNADYTQGLRQAIGVREFQDFLRFYLLENGSCESTDVNNTVSKLKFHTVLDVNDSELKDLLIEAIEKMKLSTCRLVRRQKRRLNRLMTFFGWDLQYVDATEAFLCKSEDDAWGEKVVGPCMSIIKSFLHKQASLEVDSKQVYFKQQSDQRDLWTQYICEFCDNRILRGANEWEQHKKGRSHRKRLLSVRKKASQCGLSGR